MYKNPEKSKKSKNEAIDIPVAQKKTNGKQGFEFVDNRPDAATQRKTKLIATEVLSGAKIQLKSKAHTHGCLCPSCTNSHQLLQAKKILNGGTVQRFTTVSIKDNLGQNASGQSGNESATRGIFAKWPELKNSFESNVHPVDMPVLDEDGKETGATYPRNRYMCAEPNALSSLLRHYNNVAHPLNNGWLAGIEFPELATDNKTGQKIKPCPVCSQWVSENAPMKIQGLDGGSFTNEAQQDRMQELAHLEHLRQEQEAEKAQEKERKKQEKQTSQNAQEAKSEVITEIKKLDANFIFSLVSPISDRMAKEWDIYGKKKKINTEKLKEFTDDCISNWMASLKITDVNIIKMYKLFKDDAAFQREFKDWASVSLI